MNNNEVSIDEVIIVYKMEGNIKSTIDRSNPVEITDEQFKELGFHIAYPEFIEEDGVIKKAIKEQWYKLQDGSLTWEPIYEPFEIGNRNINYR